MALLTRRFKKFIKRKEVRRTDQGDRERKPNNKEEERRCFNCDKVGYIAANCRVKQNKGKKAFAATWDDEDDELDISDSEVSEFGFIASIDNEQNDYLDEDVTDGDIYTAFENADPRAVLCLWMFFWMAIPCWFGLSMPIGYSSLINALGLIFWDLICFMPPTTMSLSHADKAVLEMERNCDQKLAEHKEESPQYLMHIQEEHAALYFREDLHRRLLSTDFKMQVDGIEMLHKVLEFLPELFDMLRIEWYTLTVSEAAIFLPCLVEKVGKGKSKAVPIPNIVEASSVNQEGELTELSLVGGPSAITSIGSSEASVNDIIITNVEKAGSILCTLPVKNHDPGDPSLLQLAIIQPNSMVEAASDVWQQVGKGKSKAVPIPNIVEASSVNQEGELTVLSLVGGPSAITSIGSSEASVNDIIITNVEKAGSILCTLPVKNHDPGDPSLLQLAIIQPNSMVEAASDVVNERDHSDDSPFTPVLSKKAAKKAAKAAKIKNLSSSKGKS
ncbi:hypothetical protein RHGRI_026485 [Rhododendron griersonianum]|uniref:CCHC-type domain-containing protein n=1 Tax=Rhododendron griersonianum TaxID=479676 RepID=A0AAV6IZ62_9ERIC|nr:hypothetical protein RHGRI_026485 [Rhododendron griersonianum]